MIHRWGKMTVFKYLFVVLMLIYPFLVGQSSYFMSLLVTASVFMIAAMALDLLVGFGGQVSVGNAGFLTVGAYAVAILGDRFELPIWLLIPAAGVITGLIGLIISLPAVRLSGHFLAVATLGFGISLPPIALNWESLTKGASGISVHRSAALSSDLSIFYVIIVATLLVAWMLNNILKSRMGRAFMAIRDSEITAEATGINTFFYKTVMFVISAFFTGIAGGLSAYWVGYISPDNYSMTTSIYLLSMIVVGGLASLPGAIIGAILFTVLPHFTDAYAGMTTMVIGVVLILVIVFRPAGLVSLSDALKRNPKRKEERQHAQVR